MTSNATDATRRTLAETAEHLPMHDTQDFADAERGLLARSKDRQVRAADGRVVWDLDAYGFLDGAAPDTANPSLWRQGQLLTKDGLFEVVPGIYQVRGFDLSTMTLVEGDTGVIVIDPLICKETAAAAFALYTAHRGHRPVVAMIYTHSHIDHFGGVKGIISQDDVDAGRVPVIAPEGFMEHAIVENIFAGTAMARRAGYMYGAAVDKGPAGQIGAGLGQTTSTGEATLIVPTIDITTTGQELTIDGVRIVFQVTPGTEAPAEMNFYFPDFHALCAAENASHTLHNILTIRGAVVRDAHAWAHYLTETIDLFGDQLDVVFASHHWPTWDRERAVEYLAMQRDMYLYLHDQTLRLINQGYVGAEIAETAARCHPRWRRRGTPTATTGRSATTSRPSTSATSAGTTATRPGCGRTHRSRRPPATSPPWAGSTPPSGSPSRPTTRATTGGPRRSSTTSCSPTRPTPQPGRCRPTPSSSWPSAPRTAPGAAPTSPAPRNSATASSAPPPPPPPPTSSAR